MKLLTIIITVFDTETKYLDRLISSILKNDLTDVDILFVDNGSTKKETIKWIDKTVNKYNFKSVRTDNNLGISGGRNLGINSSNSKYIWMIDSDDYISSDAIKSFKDVIKENAHLDFYAFNFKFDYGNNKLIESQEVWAPYNYDGQNIYGYGIIWCKIFNLEFLNKNNIRFPKNNYEHEDVAFMWQVMFYVNKFLATKKCFYMYVKNNSFAFSNEFSNLKSYIAYSKHLEYYWPIFKNNKSELFKKYMFHFISWFINIIMWDEIDFKSWNDHIKIFKKYIKKYYPMKFKILFVILLSNKMFRKITYNLLLYRKRNKK